MSKLRLFPDGLRLSISCSDLREAILKGEIVVTVHAKSGEFDGIFRSSYSSLKTS